MQENVAKNGWELTKVARIGRSRSLYSQKRVEGGVGQSREPKLSVCCLHASAHPFLAKNRPGAPVFGCCPKKIVRMHQAHTYIPAFIVQDATDIEGMAYEKGKPNKTNRSQINPNGDKAGNA